MSDKKKSESSGAVASEAPKTPHQESAAQARSAERNRVMAIVSICAMHNLGEDFQKNAIQGEWSAEKTKAKALDVLAERDSDVLPGSLSPHDIEVGQSDREKKSDGVRLALEARGGLLQGDEARKARQGNPFASMTLGEMCMHFSDAQRGCSRRDAIGRVLASAYAVRPMAASSGTHTTSDFPSTLANVASKSLLQGYSAQRETWSAWTNRGELNDYRIAKRVGVDMASNLLKVEEGAEYEAGTIDDRGIDISLGKYGRMLPITREAILNDDLSQMTEIPRKMGAAAQRLVGNLVYKVLADNAFQGGSLFAGAHNNTHTVALDEAGLQTLITAMMTLEDPNAKGSTLGIEPRFLLVPAALNLAARKLVNAAINASGATNVQQNIVEVITEGRLDLNDPTHWFVTADPNTTDTVEVAFLNGNETPFIEQIAMPTVDGVMFKVRHEVGVAARARQGIQRSTGA